MKSLAVTVGVTLAFIGCGLFLHDRAAGYGGLAPQGGKAAPASPSMKPEDIDHLLAPVALYPDQLLGEMLIAAGNPGKIAALNEWLASHQNLKGSELQDAVSKSGFTSSYVTLAVFPDVVKYMAEQFDWTTRLGQAFATDRSAVFGSIQRLRAKAKDAGKLKSTPQQDVETKTTSSGEQVIVIEPSNPQVVYVPQYNPTTVYTQPTTSTVVVQQESSSSDAVAAGLIGFTAGIAMGAAFSNDYYYGPYGWHGGAYMYNDAWDDYYDHREDAREDWQDHREDLAEERGDTARNAQEQRTERAETRSENRPEAQAQRTERQQNRQANASPETQAKVDQRRSDAQAKASEARSTGATSAGATSQEARGYSRDTGQAARDRSGTKSDAFSGYSSGKSERSASQRGQRSRSSSRSGGGSRRR